jgi:hypothetical protein
MNESNGFTAIGNGRIQLLLDLAWNSTWLEICNFCSPKGTNSMRGSCYSADKGVPFLHGI